MSNVKFTNTQRKQLKNCLISLLVIPFLITVSNTSCSLIDSFSQSPASNPSTTTSSTTASTTPSTGSIPPPPIAPETTSAKPPQTNISSSSATTLPLSPSNQSTTTQTTPSKNQSINISQLEQQIHNTINYVRTSAGLQPLAWNETLNKIAQNHSLDMALRNYFDHISPEGHDMSDRYLAGGFRITVGGAENIFQCSHIKYQWYINGIPSNAEYYTQEEIALLTVKSWLESTGHRQNILTPDWSVEGIGVATSSSGEIYVTQNFG